MSRDLTAGLQGDFRGTCVVCLRPTDTVLGFRGSAEWVIVGLQVLGVPEDQAYLTAFEAWQEEAKRAGAPLVLGDVPAGVVSMAVRVCRACVAKSEVTLPEPVLDLDGTAVPYVLQPGQP